MEEIWAAVYRLRFTKPLRSVHHCKWRTALGNNSKSEFKKIADAPDGMVDFLLNGNNEYQAKASLNDAEVIRYYKEVDNLPQKINQPC